MRRPIRLQRECQNARVSPDQGQPHEWRRDRLIGVIRLRAVVAVRVACHTDVMILEIAVAVGWDRRNHRRCAPCVTRDCRTRVRRNPQLTENQREHHGNGDECSFDRAAHGI